MFDRNISKIYAKAIICKSRTEYEFLVVKSDGKNLRENHFSCTDNKERREHKVDGDLEMVDSVDTMFLAGPGLMELTATNGVRKRKDGRNDEVDKQVKFFRCHLGDYSVRQKALLLGGDDGLSSGSDIDNPVSGEDMECMEQ